MLLGKSQKVIYTDGTGSDNPYEKMRIKIVPTRLAVKALIDLVPSAFPIFWSLPAT